MKSISLVMKAAINSNLRLRSVAIVAIGVVLICAIGVAAIFISQAIFPELNKATPDRSLLESYFSLVLFTTSIISIGIYASVFAFQSMTREKSRGNIQALLATPLNPADIWLGKSLAVFVPGLVFATILTLIAFLAVNYIYFVPKVGLIVTPWMIIANFIGVPLVYLALTLLVHVIGLAGKPATGNVIAQIFLPVMITLIINLVMRSALSAGTWLFMVIILGLAAALGIVVLIIRSNLTTERIILSQ
jgi:ABC-2 type transport system permease protein